MRIASFDVDAQKGFTPLCPNELPVLGGDEIVEDLNRLVLRAQFRVGSKDCHPENAIWIADKDHPVLSKIEHGGPNVDVYWPKHCMVGTVGNELLDGLPKVTEYSYFVYKGIEKDLHPYGACYQDLEEKLSTGVIEFLRDRDVVLVLVGGLALDYCVKVTALQLAKYFKVAVYLKACRSVIPTNNAEVIKRMEEKGIVVCETVNEIDDYIGILNNNRK